LVIGVGGLGHLAVQILAATTAARVIATDVRPEALQLALDCGADQVVLAGESAAQEVRYATRGRGADVILDFVASDSTMALGAAVGRMLGDFSVVGIGGGSLKFAGRAVAHELSIQHPYWGTRPELREVLNLASRGLLQAEITTFALENALVAYRGIEEGHMLGRAVITPNLA